MLKNPFAKEDKRSETVKFDLDHIWHPFTQHKIAPDPILIKSAKDEFLIIEDEDGNEKKIIDGISSWWVNTHGHSNSYINEQIKKQLDTCEHAIFAGFTHEPAVKLVEKLLPLLPSVDVSDIDSKKQSSKLSKVFFSDNGSTSVEVAIKMAIQHWYNIGKIEKNGVIAFKGSYHGDTLGAMSASGTGLFFDAFKKIMFDVDFVDSPSSSPYYSNSPNEQNTLEQIEALLRTKKDKIAALIIEPLVQGAGGMKFHSARFLQKLKRLCNQNNIIFIADEVFVGFGRTGKMFACEKAMIVPDIICLSKGLTGGYLPLGLTVTSQDIYQAFHSDSKMKTFFHGHSFTGNPLSCTAAIASLELFENENRMKDVDFINAKMERVLNVPSLKENPLVKDVRIIGALAVIELHDSQDDYLSDIGPKLSKEFLKRHMLLRPLGNVLYFLPPYTISVKSLDYCLESIKQVLSSLSQ